MNHKEIVFSFKDEIEKDSLIIALCSIGFDGFAEEENTLKAYIEEEHFDESVLKNTANNYHFTFEVNHIQEQNWNQLWESNYEPVVVDNFVAVIADFHKSIPGVTHEIRITPKMSFGTGHHATTFLVLKLMSEIDFSEKEVFDFGTGTGILAIMANKLGASRTYAIDYDNWCIENAAENLERNKSEKIVLEKGDTAECNQQFDIQIANINKNIIQDNVEFLAKQGDTGALLLLSGLLEEDEHDIHKLFTERGWVQQKVLRKNGWIALQFIKKTNI